MTLNKTLDKKVMYHYCGVSSWKALIEGYKDVPFKDLGVSENFRGLLPSTPLIDPGLASSFVPPEATQYSLFGLLEPAPQSWLDYRGSNDIFGSLMHHCVYKKKSTHFGPKEIILLRVELNPEDEPYVVDFVHQIEAVRAHDLAINYAENMSRSKIKEILINGFKQYWESRISLAEYDGSYVLPEVILSKPKSIEDINFLWKKELGQYLEEVRSTN